MHTKTHRGARHAFSCVVVYGGVENYDLAGGNALR